MSPSHSSDYPKHRVRRSHPPARRKRPGFLSFALVAAVLVALALFILPHALSTSPPEGNSQQEQVMDALRKLARNQPEFQPLLDHPEQYPQELLELAVRNPEALEFVLGYPEDKDLPPAQDVGEVTQGFFPLLMQWDPRWGYQTYGDGLLALTGCGPAVLSMVVCGLTGDNTVTPWTVAQYADQAGWYVDGSGSSWDLIREGCRHYGLNAWELSLDEGVMARALNQGEAIICSVGPGNFTTSGHFILITGLEGDSFRINDPNRRSNSEILWDYDTLAPQIRNLWACTLME